MYYSPPAEVPLQRIQTQLLYPITIGFALFGLLAAYGFEPTGIWQYAPFAISMVLLGLPHGAADHLVISRLTHTPIRLKRMALFCTVYLICALLYGGLWLIAPAFSALFFVGMTWFHWGQGELYVIQSLLQGDYVKSRPQKALLVLIRGSLPMLIPFLAYPDVYRTFVEGFVTLITDDPAALSLIQTVLSGDRVNGIWLGFLFLVTVYFCWIWAEVGESGTAESRYAALADMAEVSILVLFFIMVSPILAVGLYFCFWHSVRHLLRLSLLDSVGQQAWRVGDIGRVVRRLIWDTTPLTLISLIFLGILARFVPFQPENITETTAFYLAFIAMLTLPHTLTVIWMDFQQRVWLPGDEMNPDSNEALY